MKSEQVGIQIKKMILAALFLALGMVFPFFTAQIRLIGRTLLPMHIPVMLCGLICGAPYGFVIGAITPLFRCFFFGMPTLFPDAASMAFELATYGLVIGWSYGRFKQKNLAALYISLVAAMLAGRAVWGIASVLFFGIEGTVFTFGAFVSGGFVLALPGIVLQLLLIPLIMTTWNRFRTSRSVPEPPPPSESENESHPSE